MVPSKEPPTVLWSWAGGEGVGLLQAPLPSLLVRSCLQEGAPVNLSPSSTASWTVLDCSLSFKGQCLGRPFSGSLSLSDFPEALLSAVLKFVPSPSVGPSVRCASLPTPEFSQRCCYFHEAVSDFFFAKQKSPLFLWTLLHLLWTSVGAFSLFCDSFNFSLFVCLFVLAYSFFWQILTTVVPRYPWGFAQVP